MDRRGLPAGSPAAYARPAGANGRIQVAAAGGRGRGRTHAPHLTRKYRTPFGVAERV